MKTPTLESLLMGVAKPWTHFHPASSTPTQLHQSPHISTQLHPAPSSLFQPPPSFFQHPQRYKNQNIALNWATFPSLSQKLKVICFAWKLAHMEKDF